MRGLDGKVAVVTGGANGIGQASAARLAEEGVHVVVVDVDGEAAERVAAGLPTESAGAKGDVASEADTDAYVELALRRFGRIDLHHLNAGVPGSFSRLPDLSVADFEAVMSVNLRGMFLGLRAAFRQYEAQARRGHVWRPTRRAVNAVAPGIVPTGLFAAAATTRGGMNDMAARASTSPLRCAGRPAEIAGVVAFLLSDDASYMTGEVVSADGGASIVSTVRPSGGAGAWDAAALDESFYET